MGSPTGELQSLFDQMVSTHGEEAVRRALQLTPVVSLVRDSASFHLDTASRAAGTEGVTGALVLELPRKANQPTEVSFLGGRPELVIKT